MWGQQRLKLNSVLLALLAVGKVGVVLTAAYAADEKDEKSDAATTGSLIEKLESSVGSPINVELKSGQSFLRAKLLRANVNRNKGTVVSISIQEAEGGKTRLLTFGVIRSIILDREKVYEAAITAPKTPAEKRLKEQLEKAAKEREEWTARAKKNGVEPWLVLSQEEHDAVTKEHHEVIARIEKEIPGMQLYETQEFLFCSNIPKNQVAPYTKALDSMHDMMCKMYDIKQGEPVWKGKCLVMAFLNKEEFVYFEKVIFNHEVDLTKAYGLCHPDSDGRVIVSCYRGDQPAEFANMLVHETSHGFIHRYRTPARIPSWINEGMADCISKTLVPTSSSVQRQEQAALQRMLQTRSMGGDFLTRKGNIEPWQYGIASSITSFLMKSDKAAYTKFIQGIKEGLTWQDSLKAAYSRTPEELVAAYGKAIGIPDLKP